MAISTLVVAKRTTLQPKPLATRFLTVFFLNLLKILFSNPFVYVSLTLLLLSLTFYVFSFFKELLSLLLITLFTIYYAYHKTIIAKTTTFLDRLSVSSIKYLLLTLSIVPSTINGLSLAFLATYVSASHSFIFPIAHVAASTACAFHHSFHLAQPQPQLRLQLIAVLHVSAILASISSLDASSSARIGAPIVFVLAAYVVSLCPSDLFQRSLREALRRSGGQVIREVGEEVRGDELLMIAMGKWIVEFWSTRSADPTTATPIPTRSESENENENEIENEHCHESPSPNFTPTSPNLTWPDLHSMLLETIAQASEASTPSSNANQNAIPNPNPNPSLQTLLTNFDVDASAKPFVQNYTKAVNSIPPTSPTFALFMRSARDCPSLLALFFICLSPPSAGEFHSVSPLAL